MLETLQFNLAGKAFPLLFLIPLLPLLGAFIAGILGAQLQKRFGKWVINVVALTPVWLSFAISVYAFLTLVRTPDVILTDSLWKWIDFRWQGVHIDVDFSFAVDRLSSVMILVVTGVGSLIHVFSTGYMQDEKPYWRFFAEMNLFMFAMLVLVMGDSFLMMFVGWEGVGLCSYLLISYYYEEKDKAAAGMKAFVVNRIGDFAFIAGMALLLWGLVGTWRDGGYVFEGGTQPTLVFRKIEALLMSPDFRAAFLAREAWGMPVVTLSTILFFIGACGKS
ncbi:MAG: NADH-quinone oxidoreductase subunit L, partial [Deltaproteobacteria bacterium]|nr:NADH-quinone oxidoreductase subunit L [Deltaproteobacteria bacterium]